KKAYAVYPNLICCRRYCYYWPYWYWVIPFICSILLPKILVNISRLLFLKHLMSMLMMVWLVLIGSQVGRYFSGHGGSLGPLLSVCLSRVLAVVVHCVSLSLA